jgi:hypothetical protein
MTRAKENPATLAARGARVEFDCVAASNSPENNAPSSELQAARAHCLELLYASEQSFCEAFASGDRERALDLFYRHLCLYESERRPRVFLNLISVADGPFFWRAVGRHWSGFDLIPHREFARLFKRHRATWSPKVLRPNDLDFYEPLPETVQVFRGQTNGPVGLSWTTNCDCAEDFARGHRGIRVKEPVVIGATIRKADIALVQTDRMENEVVIFSGQRARDREVTPIATLCFGEPRHEQD